MYFSFQEATEWTNQYFSSLDSLSRNIIHQIILCPSFEALSSTATKLRGSHIQIGAQDCSSHQLGAYTGQISAISLAQIGCSYCIIGHSERRQLLHEEDNIIVQKAIQLISYNIIPILCVGETKEEYQSGITKSVIRRQLSPFGHLGLTTTKATNQPFLIAYEPIWSIGTGIIPEREYLEEILNLLQEITSSWASKSKIAFLYGGSVNENTISHLASIDLLGGFLIGKASTDFQELKKIVLSV
jgi:triosephosphate isomerase